MAMRQLWHWLWAVLLCTMLLILNLRAYTPVSQTQTTLAQLRFLHNALEHGSAEAAQNIFPEGYFFSWVLYGLGNAQLAAQLPTSHPERLWLLKNAQTALQKLESADGKKIFPQELEPPHGAFYNGWVLYLKGQLLRAIGIKNGAPKLLQSFQTGCARFAKALEQSRTPFLQSYTELSWAADNSIAIAALGIHDSLFAPKFKQAIADWVNVAKQRLEPDLGTLPHRNHPETGKSLERTRGSSLAMMILALGHAAPEFAAEQYQKLRQYFYATNLGIPGVLEYPKGSFGTGDVDSGPIVLGYSGPAVIVGMGAAISMNDMAAANAFNGFVEMGGFAFQGFGERRYLFGTLPIGDAFLVWVRTMTPLVKLQWQPVFPVVWAWGLHLVSLLLLGLVVWRIVKPSSR
jgi:hypothetical protein